MKSPPENFLVKDNSVLGKVTNFHGDRIKIKAVQNRAGIIGPPPLKGLREAFLFPHSRVLLAFFFQESCSNLF